MAVLGNKGLEEEVKEVILNMTRSIATALLPDGSLYHELDVTANHYAKHREWWVSAEAMVGSLNAYQFTGKEKYVGYSYNSWKFIQKHLLDVEGGEWYWGVYDDYTVMKTFNKIGFWKCPYHNSRGCLEVINRIIFYTDGCSVKEENSGI